MAHSGLNINRLKGKIKAAFLYEQTEEVDWNASLDRFSEKIATAIVEEIKEIKANVTKGIPVNTTGTATAQSGQTVADKLADIS